MDKWTRVGGALLAVAALVVLAIMEAATPPQTQGAQTGESLTLQMYTDLRELRQTLTRISTEHGLLLSKVDEQSKQLDKLRSDISSMSNLGWLPPSAIQSDANIRLDQKALADRLEEIERHMAQEARQRERDHADNMKYSFLVLSPLSASLVTMMVGYLKSRKHQKILKQDVGEIKTMLTQNKV